MGSLMPEDYTKSFGEALAIIQHALIYDASSKSLKHLKPLSEKFLQSLDGDHDFLGPDTPQSVAIAIAEGRLDPSTMDAFGSIPSSKVHLKSTTATTQISKELPRIDTTTVSKEVSCSSVISSHRTKKERTTRLSKKKQKPSKGPSFTNEMAGLAKLVCPFNTAIEENTTCGDKVV